jgi:hypothetical protein
VPIGALVPLLPALIGVVVEPPLPLAVAAGAQLGAPGTHTLPLPALFFGVSAAHPTSSAKAQRANRTSPVRAQIMGNLHGESATR